MILKNILLDSILALGQLPSRITTLLKKKFYLLYYVFQNFKMTFLIIVDCKSAKEVLQKDVQNLVSKQSFARWQTILSVFNFDIEYIKGETNLIPDFLTCEFLQAPCR